MKLNVQAMKKLFLFLPAMLLMSALAAQGVPAKSAVERLNSDNVAEKLQKYGSNQDLPVSSGGDVNVQVPLYTIKGRRLSLPITLNYQAGIKVDQKASDVGLGWTIDFGKISRDFGAYEPDYAEINRDEVGTGTEKLGGGTFPNSQYNATAFYPAQTAGANLKFDGLYNTQAIPDDYHVSIPGVGGGTFWNNGVSTFDWKWSQMKNWKVKEEPYDFTFDQEFSRVNEVNFPDNEDLTEFNSGFGSYAAAITIPDYVTSHFSAKTVLVEGNGIVTLNDILASPAKNIRYRDFKGFTLVDENGTEYLFKKPLRAQKYVFSENPYWSTMSSRQRSELGPPATNFSSETSLGEGWKQEYIAQWCLTEIHTYDYIDVNGDGIANDGDQGDWIRIEYDRDYWRNGSENETTLENVLISGTYSQIGNRYPYYREYDNFSQTDIASSTWHEIAYVKRIVTPIQELKVDFTPRMEVDFDYYEQIANPKYQESYRMMLGNTNWAGFENSLKIQYPHNRLQKYEGFEIHDRVLGPEIANGVPESTRMISRASLEYARMGAPEQLCVSNYLIRDNSNVEGNYGSPNTPDRPIQHPAGRGKTTLLAVSFVGDDSSPIPVEKHRYEFNYGYNPDYTPIHRAKMWGDLYYPNKRESYGTGNWKADPIWHYNMNYFPSLEPFKMAQNVTNFAHELHIGAVVSWPYFRTFAPPTSTIPSFNSGLEKLMNETGYYYQDGQIMGGINAWSLSGIKYPTGGTTSFFYNADEIELNLDSNWGVRPDELTNVQTPYNFYVNAKKIRQDALNLNSCMTKQKLTSDEFEFPLRTIGSGLRIGGIETNDGAGNSYMRAFTYGSGTLTRISRDYWQSFSSAFQKHLRIQKAKRLAEFYCAIIPGAPFDYFENDFDVYDQYYSAQVRIDKNLDHEVVYEWIKENLTDGSSIKRSYQVNPSNNSINEVRIQKGLSDLSKDVHVISGNPLYGIGLPIRTEYFKAGSTTPYASEAQSYQHQVLGSKDITFDSNNSPKMRLNCTLYTYHTVSCHVGNPPCNGQDYFVPDSAFLSNLSPYTPIRSILSLPRSVSVSSILKSKTTNYESLTTNQEFIYTPSTFQLRATKTGNSALSNGGQDVRISKTKYAWEQYTGAELAKLQEKNLLSWPVYQQTFGTNSMLPNVWPDNELLASTCQTIDYVNTGAGFQLYPGKRYYFNTDNINPTQGWLQGYSAFVPPAFVSGTSQTNAPEWTEADAVILKRDNFGNPTFFDTPYQSGRIIYGYNRTVPQARFENTGGLDASFIGYEDASPSDFSNNPTDVILGDDWLKSTTPGNISKLRAHTGGASYKLNAGQESYLKAISVVPIVHFAGNQAIPNTNGKYDYKVSWWIYSATPTNYELTISPTVGSPITFNLTVQAGNTGGWKYVEQTFEAEPSWLSFKPSIRHTSTSGELFLDDMLVYPKSAEYEYYSLNHRRQMTSFTGFNDESQKTVYDHFGRQKEEYDAKGDLLSTYRYKVTGNLPAENSYVEVAKYSDAARVGISRVYLDGLGRNKQTIVWEPSNLRGIISQTTDYDVVGRPFQKWNPVPLPNLVSGLPMQFVSNYTQRGIAFYNSSYPYSRTEYDLTPEGRPLKQFHPRMNLDASTFIKFEYKSNTAPVVGYAANELLVIVKTNEEGGVFYEYMDKVGNKVYITQPLDAGYSDLPLGGVSFLQGSLQYALTVMKYDQANRLKTITNPSNQMTSFVYNSRGDILQETQPDRGVTKFRYDRWGRLRFAMDANEAANATFPDPQVNCTGNCQLFKYFKYDRLSRPREEGQLFTTNSSHFNDIAFRNDQNFPASGLAYKPYIINIYGNTTSTQKGSLASQKINHEFSFNPQSLVFTPTISDKTLYTYDQNRRLITAKSTLDGLAGSHEFKSQYNRQGQLTNSSYVSDPNQKEYYRSIEFDDFGRQVSAYSGYNDLVLQQTYDVLDSRYVYDAIGRLYKKYVGPTGNSSAPWHSTTEIFHDIRNRMTKIASEKLNIELKYDRRGNIIVQRWQNGQFDTDPDEWNNFKYFYDHAYRLVAADYSTTKIDCGPSTERLATIPLEPFLKNGNEIYTAAKDQADEPTYDPKAILDRNLQMSYLDYSDNDESIQALYERLGEPAFEGFDPAYRFGEIDFLEAVIDEDLRWKVAKELDLSQSAGKPCTAVIVPSDKFDTWYRYDKIGNITRLKRKQFQQSSAGFVMNLMDYTYPNAPSSNQLGKVGDQNSLFSTKYGYDANGNVISDLAPNITAISYDWRNRPTKMLSGINDYEYRYDAAGIRSYRKVGNRVEFFLPGMVLDASGSILRFDISDGFAEITQNGSMDRNYVLRDWLGTPRVTIDASGTIVQANDMDPYGRVMDQRAYTPSSESDRYRFTGHEHDAESGYDYHGARYYQPEVGRYLGVDVMANKYGGYNGYAYVLGNPTMMVDPDGMDPDDYYLNSKGVVVKIVQTESKAHRIMLERSDGTYEDRYFNSKLDYEQIEKFEVGDHAMLVFSEENINDLMKKAHVEPKGFFSRYSFAWSESTAGYLDFSNGYLWPAKGIGLGYGVSANEMDNMGGFVAFGSHRWVFNLMDGGNFLWGFAMNRLGFSPTEIINSADIHSLYSTFQHDTPEDRRAIMWGISLSQKMKTTKSIEHPDMDGLPLFDD